MKALHVLAGGPKVPDGNKLKKYGITRLYYEATDPQVDAAFFAQLRGFGYQAGFQYDPKWDGFPPPAQVVQNIINYLVKFGAVKRNADGSLTSLAPMPVMLDDELHTSEYALEIIQLFEKLLPGKNLLWTLEPNQGGWIEPELVAAINASPQLRVAPQYYLGDMTPVAPDVAMKNLIAPGIAPTSLVGFYSLRDQNWNRIPVPAFWDGVLYLENWALLP